MDVGGFTGVLWGLRGIRRDEVSLLLICLFMALSAVSIELQGKEL